MTAAKYPLVVTTNNYRIQRAVLRLSMTNADLERVLNIVARFIVSISIGALSGWLLISGSADVKAIGGALLGSITTFWFSPQNIRPQNIETANVAINGSQKNG